MSTRIGDLAAEVSMTNTWWRRADWAELDPDLGPVADSGLGYRSECLDGLAPGNLYLLRGARRVGKTVAVKQAIERLIRDGVPPTAIVRVAVDDWSAKDIRTLAQNTAIPPLPTGQRRWWFIDEITSVQGDWPKQIKWLRDNDPEFKQAAVVLTGSNAAALTAAVGVLSGRRGAQQNLDRTALPMGFHTVARLLDPDLPDLSLAISELRSAKAKVAYDHMIPWLGPLVSLWEQYLRYGGFPASVAAWRAGQPEPEGFVNTLFDVVFRDAFSRSNLSVTQTTALVQRVMESLTTPLNRSNIANDLGLSANTVKRHLEHLRDAYLTWTCPQKDDGSWTALENARDKVYAIDPLVARLVHLRNPSRPDIDITLLAEMQIGMAIARAIHRQGFPWAEDATLFYGRTTTRKEIDFLSERLAGTAVEGKYTSSGRWAREAQTVNASDYRGILTTRNVLDTKSTDGAWAVPAALLAFLIDT